MRPAGGATTSRSCGTLFVDHGTAPEKPQLDANSARDDLAYGLAAHRVLGQRTVTHALRYFEASRLAAGVARDGFISVSRHFLISTMQWHWSVFKPGRRV
jgi:hypothetical protein